ncbi:MAG: dephospho-CoA kinase [Firmicutes bacterium]|nr:dephospho-CoA kinase [Bacillota bacterium]
MKVIGLTGGIASGKSTVSMWFKDAGIPVVDTDFVYKELSKPKKVLYNKLVDAFGTQILKDDDHINWQFFSKFIFLNEAERKKLNALTHPIIRQEVIQQLQEYRASNVKLVVLVVPLLFESNFHELCDETICVYTNMKTEIERLMNRDHVDMDTAKLKIKSQMSLEKKKKLATFVIDNSKDLESTFIQFEKLLKII